MAVVPEPSVYMADRIEELEAEVRALRYALGLAKAQIEMLKNGDD